VLPYIRSQIEALEVYDAQRPQGHPYEFHLHSERMAGNLRDFALFLGWSESIADTLYWASLPHDIGKMALPPEIWDMEDKPTPEQKTVRRSHVTEGLAIIRGTFPANMLALPFMQILLDIMENHHETLDGTGFFGKKRGDLDLIVRMACICDAFDGWSVHRPHFGVRDISPDAVIGRMETEKKGQFDAELLSLFRIMKCGTPAHS